MSQDNIEIMRQHFRTWNAGDMEAHRELYDPDVIVRMPEDFPERGPFFGREAVMGQVERQVETFDANELELITDFIVLGDRLLVRFIWHGIGRGPAADIEVSGLYTVRRGRILAMEFFRNHAEALEILGVRE